MNYWIVALPRERLDFCIKVGKFGLNRKYILGSVQNGDVIVFYATKDRKIIAFGEVTEPYYLDDTPVFKDKELFPGTNLYPDRFDFKSDRLKHEIDFIEIIDKMTFIKSLANWQIHFRNAIVRISKEDWNTIASQQKTSAV